jgi:uncharacterized protein YvpB
MIKLVARAMVTLIAMTVLAPSMAISPAAATQNVTAFVEVSSTSTGVGCLVDVSVEVRSGTGGVSGADVTVSLSEDGTANVLSSDRSVTSDAGTAWLAIDTSNAWSGVKGWMEVSVNDTYLGGKTVRITDGGCGGDGASFELNGSVAAVQSSASSAEAPVTASSDKVIIPNVIQYQQQRGLSCEYSALSIATTTLGDWVSEYDFEAMIGRSDNPHWGYRGNIAGVWGNTDDYGIYASALTPALQNVGFNGTVFYGAGDTGELTAAIDRGEPTLVWIGMNGDLSHYDYASDGSRFQLTQYMHVMVVYGYDDGGVYLSDPGTGTFKYYDWGTFMWMWDVMDGMALSVSR